MKKIRKKKNTTKKGTKHYEVYEPTTLLPFLQKVLSHLSRNAVKAVLAKGNVSIDGEVITKFNYDLQEGQVVIIHQCDRSIKNKLSGLTILYEDKDIIVIEKESGLLSISNSKEKEVTAYRQLTDYVKSKHPKNRIFIVHRLDRDTSGVMMFAKSENVKRALQSEWKDIVNKRTYLAVVEGKVQKTEGNITSWLKETKTHVMYSSSKPNGGKKAITHYKVIQANPSFSLMELNLDTGRKNQIRVHMKDIGHSIVGDKKYGAQQNPIGRLGLHAKEIMFIHPISGEELQFTSKVPESFIEETRPM